MKHRNSGIRKVCGCGRTKWTKCPHGWHLNFQWGGVPYRLSIDREVGEHVGPKADAKAKADGIRSAIRPGTFRQAVPEAPTPDVLTFEAFAKLWIERARDGQVKRPANDWACVRALGKVAVHDAAVLNESPIGRITEDDLERVLAVLRKRKAPAP